MLRQLTSGFALVSFCPSPLRLLCPCSTSPFHAVYLLVHQSQRPHWFAWLTLSPKCPPSICNHLTGNIKHNTNWHLRNRNMGGALSCSPYALAPKEKSGKSRHWIIFYTNEPTDIIIKKAEYIRIHHVACKCPFSQVYSHTPYGL